MPRPTLKGYGQDCDMPTHRLVVIDNEPSIFGDRGGVALTYDPDAEVMTHLPLPTP